VVADLLYLAGLERSPAATTAPVHLDEVVVNAVREAQALRPEVPIKIDRLDETDAMGDELRLQQLLVNLLDNALGVSPAGAAVNVSLEATADTARVTVSDRGQGIPPDELERIFERFHRANGSQGVGGGTGLGLAIARSIAREHGGEVFARNRDGGGAAFVLELPADRLLPTRSPVPP
jgi:signal transduction histidine kinase